MSKFKVGDKVVRTKPCGVLSVGGTYTVVDVVNFRFGEHILLEGFEEYRHFASEYFEHQEKYELIKAIEVLGKHGIRKPSYFERSCIEGGPLMTKDELIEHLFPSETPQQKKLRELEEQQLKIAAQIKELRNSTILSSLK